MERTFTYLTDIKDASEWLAGARVERAQLAPTGRAMRLTLELTRAMLEQQREVRQGFFRRTKTPFAACRVTLNGLHDVTITHLADQPPNDTPLLSCEAVSGGYQITVQAPDGLQIVARAEQLDGAFEDVGHPMETP